MINIDNNPQNSDWIKYRGLDIPGDVTWDSLQKIMNIPKNGKSRLESIKRIQRNYVWYKALPISIRSIMDTEVKRLEKKSKDN
jgi:hypothetical protein